MQTHATAHAFVRADQRLPFSATEDDFRAVVDDIVAVLSGEARACVLLRRCPDGKEVWLARMRGHSVRVVYAPETAGVITVIVDMRQC